MRRRNFIQTLAGGSAGVALLKLGNAEKTTHTANARVAWTVRGFTCITCAVGLETILQRHEGISTVKAEYPSGRVEIAFDSRAVTAPQIQRLIEEAGFKVGERTHS
jgi:copper chaperone CopZ